MFDVFPLAHSACITAEDFLKRGFPQKALLLAQRVLARPDSIGERGSRWHRLAAECLVQLSRFAAARRHLQLAFRCDPSNAETAYELGNRYETDADGHPMNAAKWFRKAKRLDHRNPLYAASFGRAAIRVGQRKTGWQAIVDAVETCPYHEAILSMAIDAVRYVNRFGDVTRWVNRARFLMTDKAAWRKLNDQLTWATIRHQQQGDVKPAIPFLRLVGDAVPVRRDRISTPRPHLMKFRVVR